MTSSSAPQNTAGTKVDQTGPPAEMCVCVFVCGTQGKSQGREIHPPLVLAYDSPNNGLTEQRLAGKWLTVKQLERRVATNRWTHSTRRSSSQKQQECGGCHCILTPLATPYYNSTPAQKATTPFVNRSFPFKPHVGAARVCAQKGTTFRESYHDALSPRIALWAGS